MADTSSKQQLRTSVNFAGDVNNISVTLIPSKGAAITLHASLIMSLSIFESLFSPFLNGTIMIYDTYDLQQMLPLIGEELINIQVSQNDQTYTGTFMIYKMEDREVFGTRNQVYTLHFRSIEGMINENIKLSRAFKGSINNMVDELINSDGCLAANTTKKPVFIEESNNNTMFVANYWPPSKCLEFICEQARNKNNSPSFLFFENKSGLYFWSIDSLAERAVDWNFQKDSYVNEPDNNKNISEKDLRIIDISITDFDYIRRLKTGMYGSDIIYYDLTSGQYVFRSSIEFYEPKLNKNPGWTSRSPFSTAATLIRDNQHYNNFDGYGSETANTKVRQQRLATLSRMESQKLKITVHGRLQIEAGHKVSLNIPVFTTPGAESQNKYMSGNYLVLDCHHSFKKDVYTCIMNVVKDSYSVNLDG